MIKPIGNSVIKQADIEKFYESLNNLQSITNLVNAETEEISISEITTYLSKLLECTNKLVIDPIKVELSKLMDILEDKGTNDKFFEQLNYLIEFSKSEKLVEEYEPINDKFIEVYNNQTKEKGISLLCSDLDKRTGGLHKGKICSIVGGPRFSKNNLCS